MPSPANTAPVSLFYSYAHEDEALRDELAGHLKILERRGLISAWHDRQIVPGQAWDQVIDQHLSQADLVLLLLSKDFIGSDYIWGVELAQAMQRQQAQQCEVVPILVRAVDIDPADAEDLPFLKLQALPPDLKPVTSWTNRDEAWTQVAKGLRATVNGIRARKPAPPPAQPTAMPPLPPAVGAWLPTTGGAGGQRTGSSGYEYLQPSGVGSPMAGVGGPGSNADPWQPWRSSAPSGPYLPTWPPTKAAPQAPASPDPQMDILVQGIVAQVDQAQQQRGGAPLFDHHRHAVQREAQALIDHADAMRVLWVDDHPDNNLNERAMLARLQIEVVAVTGTASALARIAADAQAGEAFDLVISDWSRPAEGDDAALQLLQALRGAGHPMPVVIYHGDVDATSRQRRAALAGAAGALGEAVMPAELMALVQRALMP